MILEVKNLSVSFKMEDVISNPVRGVSFSIPEKGRVALVGESGCGKSLTALTIGGLIDRAEVKGEINFTKNDTRLAYIFQNPMQSLNPVMRVGAQIMEAFPKGISKKDKESEIFTLLEAVGLDKSAVKKYPCEFSGGQQQRIMIAMALAARADLLIADEPTTALDVTTQKEVLDLIEKIANSRDMAVLFITHNLGLVSEYSSYVNVMYAGSIIESGPVKEVLNAPRHPYTKGLIAAVPDLDAPKDAPLSDIKGIVPSPWAWPQGCAFHPRCDHAIAECSSEDFKICRFMKNVPIV
jgi:oligopeptide/dipeptide ABC transporter ATP-binding protein